ncbi:MAG: cysteine--tRNA ligase [Blastocatellia bacterium]|nr:cysteine--tRNA ligase [Blastocatellia bacterium]
MMLKFHNTLTGQVEKFVPLTDKVVRFYACGPTVHNFAHIGNFRTFTFVDLLRRYLKYRGYQVEHVMNLTDIEDKIIRKANEAGQDIRTFTETYIRYFLEDMETLDLEQPEKLVRATDHIPEMIGLVQQLLDNGLAYESDGSVYFKISRFPAYGCLSHMNFAGNLAGARVDVDEYEKADARDFVLWKGSRENEPSWEAGFGAGRPGWHLECSAMAMKYLGETFDIHCGGVDLIFPHHENEIAQSEGATGKPFVKYWLHAEHLMVDKDKMAKSLGNFHTLRDLVSQGFKPRAIRYLLLSVPYRKQLNFTIEGLQGIERRLERLTDFSKRLREAVPAAAPDAELLADIAKAQADFETALDDDLNTAEAMAAVSFLENTVNRAMAESRLTETAKAAAIAVLDKMDSVFAFFDKKSEELLDEEVQALLDERLAARKARNFARSDEIRALLAERGIILEDTRDGGSRWRRK